MPLNRRDQVVQVGDDGRLQQDGDQDKAFRTLSGEDRVISALRIVACWVLAYREDNRSRRRRASCGAAAPTSLLK